MADRLPDSITPIDTLSLQERVYHELRRLIVTGTLEPGSALTIRSVAESLGTSVMPVREAIQRLTANQALELRANKSIRVPAVSKPQFLELSDIRRAVQGLAAEMAARHASDADIDALVEQVADAASIGETADIGALLELNYAFHQAICRCAKSTYLGVLMEGVWLKLGPTYRKSIENRFLSEGKKTLDIGIRRFHRATVEAIRAHDPDRARKAAEDGVAAAIDIIVPYANFPEPGEIPPKPA